MIKDRGEGGGDLFTFLKINFGFIVFENEVRYFMVSIFVLILVIFSFKFVKEKRSIEIIRGRGRL